MKTFFTVILSTLFLAGIAQDKDPKAKEILDQVSAKTQGYETITASFTSTLENKQAGMEVTQEGLLKLKGTRFNLTLDDYLIISDGETTYTFSKTDNEVYLDDTEALAGGDIQPTQIFTMWEKGFKYNYKGEQTLNGTACHHINLYPTKPDEKNYHTIKLYIGKSDLEIKQVIAMGKSGDVYTYTVKSFTPNKSMAPTLFAFDKSEHPGVTEIDNRF